MNNKEEIDMNGNVLVLRGVSKAYPGVVALDRVDLEVKQCEILGLVGENGAGKSTLMKILVGLEQPDAGQMLLRGQRISPRNPADAIRNGIGMVFQEGSLVPNLSVKDNLFLCHEGGFRKFGLLSSRSMVQTARKVLAEVKVDIDVDTPMFETTPATRQMIEIARLLWLSRLYAQDNPILILDEPTTVLTDGERETLFSILKEIKKSASVILISHRLQEIVEESDRIAILKDGRNVTDMVAAEAQISEIERLMVGHVFSADRYREDEQGEPQDAVVLKVDQLSKAGFFEPLSFEVKKGEIVSIVGLVGSGKEKVCEVLNGLERPDGGAIYLDAQRLPMGAPSYTVKAGIGHIPIDRRSEGLALGMSVAENINLLVLKNLRSGGVLNSRMEKKNAARWIEECRVKTPSMSTMVSNLSGGNQQKVVISKWLSSHVRFLVLDHPTRGVDVGAKDEIYKLIRKLATDGIGMVIMCDTLEEDIGLSNRMLIMKDGRLVKEVDCSATRKPTPADLIDSIV